MQQTVIYVASSEGIRKNLEARSPSFTWTIIDENSLSHKDVLYLEPLKKEAQDSAKRGRIKRHYTDALAGKIELIIVDVGILDEEFAKMYWSDATSSYGATNLILNEISFPVIDNKKKTYFITSPSIDQFRSFCELLIADPTTADLLENKDKEKFICYSNSSKEFLMLYNDGYTTEEIGHHDYFVSLKRIEIKSSLKDLIALGIKGKAGSIAAETISVPGTDAKVTTQNQNDNDHHSETGSTSPPKKGWRSKAWWKENWLELKKEMGSSVKNGDVVDTEKTSEQETTEKFGTFDMLNKAGVRTA